MKKSIDKVAHLCEREREREDTPTNLFKKSIFHHHWLRGKLMSNLYVKPWYPVGAILEFDRPMDMTAIYGGTWELYGTGRMTVGIDTGDADFNSAGKTGGSKEMQSHNHDATTSEAGSHAHKTEVSGGVIASDIMRLLAADGITPNVSATAGYGGNHLNGWINNNNYYTDVPKGSNSFPGGNHKHVITMYDNGKHTHGITIKSTGTGNAGNMSPYIVVYRYRKVAY